MSPLCKDGNTRLTTLKPLSDTEEDIVVFLCLNVFNSNNSLMFSCSLKKKRKCHFCRELTIEIIRFQNCKHWFLIRLIWKSFHWWHWHWHSHWHPCMVGHLKFRLQLSILYCSKSFGNIKKFSAQLSKNSFVEKIKI